MPIWYFLRVPDLPWEVADQSKSVSIIRYCIREGVWVKPGEAIAEAETWWATLKIQARYPCRIGKRFFDSPHMRGVVVGIGEPIALALCDPEDAPKEKLSTTVEILHVKREKPKK